MEKASHDEVLIAALLHDLGKVAQRAGDEKCLTEKMDGQLLPTTPDGRYTHKHAWYTHGAILELRDSLPNGIDCEKVARIAACHHNPGTWDEWIIAESDRISSGADRSPRELESETRGNYIEQQSLSIFSSVNLGSAEQAPEIFLGLGPMEGDIVYPKSSSKNDKAEYRKTWDGLLFDLKAIREKDVDAWLAAADAALERWTWSIPSTTVDQPDISLYDHSRTCAAYASALYRYHEGRCDLENIQAIRDGRALKFLLVTGELSGIQRYLYDLKSAEKSAKMLRARSFELRVLSESTGRMLQHRFGLSRFSQIGNAGGRFTIVLPNHEDARSKLEAIRSDVEVNMIGRYLGIVSLSVSSGVPVSKETLLQGRFKETFRKIMKDAAEAKQKKLQSGLLRTGHVLSEGYNAIEKNYAAGAGVCSVCDARPERSPGEPCDVCESLIEVGTLLPKADRLALARKPAFVNGLRLLDGEAVSFVLPDQEASPGLLLTSVHSFRSGMGISRMPYTVPVENGKVKEFEDIALSSEGVSHLAMLKADLDNLGAIFSSGLGESVSISRYATLSRTVDYFFTVEVRNILENDSRFKDVYTVYSGGDDLCVIGPWNVIFELAHETRSFFRKFTGGNKSLSISAGLAIASSRLPVRRIAESAEEELKAAKERPGKDGISVFGVPLSWDEFESYLSDGKVLASELANRTCPTKAVYSLIENSRKAEAFLSGDISRKNALWRSHFEYALRRSEASSRSVDVMRKYSVDASAMLKARVSASYALYCNRREGGR